MNGKLTMEELVANMSSTELADLVEGGTYDGLSAGSSSSAVIGSQADSVYGAAGETTSNLYNSRYIPNIVLSDDLQVSVSQKSTSSTNWSVQMRHLMQTRLTIQASTAGAA